MNNAQDFLKEAIEEHESMWEIGMFGNDETANKVMALVIQEHADNTHMNVTEFLDMCVTLSAIN